MRILAFSDLHRDADALARILDAVPQADRARLGPTHVANLGPTVTWFDI